MGFTGQMTQPTVSKHWRKIGPKDYAKSKGQRLNVKQT